MANSFPNCLFAVLWTCPENKVAASKWSRMEMSEGMVRSTFTREFFRRERPSAVTVALAGWAFKPPCCVI